MQSNLVETLIGAIVVVIAAAFLFYGYSTSGMRGTEGYHINAKFAKVDGLATGSDVRLSGIKIGTVVSQKLDANTYQADVVMSISSDVKIPDDSSARITSDGLLGSNYIALTPGGSDDMLKDGQLLAYTQGSVDFVSLLGQAVFSPKSSGGPAQPGQDGQAPSTGAPDPHSPHSATAP